MSPKVTDKPPRGERRRPGRIPTSCAECRRLKLRCDRKIPCETCKKRGCESICPTGSLPSSKGNRMEMHEKNGRLVSRINELETALRALQAKVSTQPHPLLQDASLPALPPPSDSPSSPPTMTPEDARIEEVDLLESSGTLSIGTSGETIFLGNTARSEYLIQATPNPPGPTSALLPGLSKRILEAPSFDVDYAVDEDLVRHVVSALPPLAVAVQLCNTYIEQGKHFYNPLPRAQLFDELLNVVYRAESLTPSKFHHALSLLYIIFAIGTLLDQSLPSCSTEAQEFFHLAKVSLAISPPIRVITLEAVQTLIYITHYIQLSDVGLSGSAKSWVTLGLAVRLGYSMGLHLNSARWKLDGATSQKRQQVFWDLFMVDTWLSFAFGRPPSMAPAYIDCPLPTFDFVTNKDGKKEISFRSWALQWTKLLYNVLTSAFGAKPPAYTTIMDFDKKIRTFPVPVYLRPPSCSAPAESDVTADLHMQRWWVLAAKEATLLNLHRPHLVEALKDQPQDPLKHKYWPSVLATYRSAWRLIHGLKHLPWRHVPHIVGRIPLAWSRGISSAIIMSLLVTRAPDSTLAKPAMEQLDVIMELFTEAAPTSGVASAHLEWIQKLWSIARDALDQSGPRDIPPTTRVELDRLAGQTHFISGMTPMSPSSYAGPSSGTSTTCVSPLDSPHQAAPAPAILFKMEDVHPTIVRDLKVFEGVQVAERSHETNDIFDSHLDDIYYDEITMEDVQFSNTGQFPLDSFQHSQSRSHSTDGRSLTPVYPSQSQSQSQSFMDFGAGPPALDATWQRMLEHLGYD